MHNGKPHKGLQKRVKVTAKGKIKHSKVGGMHRKSRHSSKQNRQLRQPMIATEVETRRLQQLLGFKIKREKTPSSTETDAN